MCTDRLWMGFSPSGEVEVKRGVRLELTLTETQAIDVYAWCVENLYLGNLVVAPLDKIERAAELFAERRYFVICPECTELVGMKRKRLWSSEITKLCLICLQPRVCNSFMTIREREGEADFLWNRYYLKKKSPLQWQG